jgi:hypothetical protein
MLRGGAHAVVAGYEGPRHLLLLVAVLLMVEKPAIRHTKQANNKK